MPDEINKKECYYHSALILSKKVRIGTEKANSDLAKLLRSYGTFEEIYHQLNKSASKENILSDNNLLDLEKRIEKASLFKTLTINSTDFPKHLSSRYGSTPVLYVCGDISLLSNKSIAVVGTRKLQDDIDIKEGIDIVRRLVEHGYTVVSGLAEGCDTLGHTKAIELGGKTIAVLGTPIDSYYPNSNRKLQEKIAKEHLLVSQYPVGIRTFPSYFAHRNHTTVSLSTDGIIVIRAGDDSGTKHAIKQCKIQEKPIYVLLNNYHKGYKWVYEYRDSIKVPNWRKKE